MREREEQERPSTLDLSALAGPPPSAAAGPQPGGLDSLESQMAALHGSTGAK
jgi:hypothetical protein